MEGKGSLVSMSLRSPPLEQVCKRLPGILFLGPCPGRLLYVAFTAVASTGLDLTRRLGTLLPHTHTSHFHSSRVSCGGTPPLSFPWAFPTQ